MPVATYLNEVELSSIECWPLDVDKWLSSPTREFPTVPIPGRQLALPMDGLSDRSLE